MRRAAGLLLGCRGRIFLALRSAVVAKPGTWGVPGGKLEPGESWREGAVREALEEFGSLPVFVARRRVDVSEGDLTFATFVCEVDPSDAAAWKPRTNDEHVRCGWFPVGALPSPMHPGLAKAIMLLAEREGRHVAG